MRQLSYTDTRGWDETRRIFLLLFNLCSLKRSRWANEPLIYPLQFVLVLQPKLAAVRRRAGSFVTLPSVYVLLPACRVASPRALNSLMSARSLRASLRRSCSAGFPVASALLLFVDSPWPSEGLRCWTAWIIRFLFYYSEDCISFWRLKLLTEKQWRKSALVVFYLLSAHTGSYLPDSVMTSSVSTCRLISLMVCRDEATNPS